MNIYGVKFSEKGKIYYFTASGLNINNNVCVIVNTEKGLQYGKVVQKVAEQDIANFKDTLKEIVRTTTKEDYKKHLQNLKDADSSLKTAQKLARELSLDMRFLTASFTFDKKQLLFTFTADERVDFREHTRKLASIYRTRIELRQIGARDKACNVGGIGPCGRELCCSSFLTSLESVSMNMAKNQNLALNPSKINGCCGRLFCCLAYEDQAYLEAQKGLPSVGNVIHYENKKGKVISVDVLNRKIKLDCNNEIIEVDMNNESRQ